MNGVLRVRLQNESAFARADPSVTERKRFCACQRQGVRILRSGSTWMPGPFPHAKPDELHGEGEAVGGFNCDIERLGDNRIRIIYRENTS